MKELGTDKSLTNNIAAETGNSPVAYVSLLDGFSMKIGDKVLNNNINRSIKLWNLMAYIVLHRGRNIPQSEFVDMLWPGESGGNPVNALKTLFFRIRRMVEEVFESDIDLISSGYGSYSWNPRIQCVTDVEAFEGFCKHALNQELDDEKRLACFRQAFALYKSDFLVNLQSQLWTIPFRVHYHNLYVQAVKECCALLSARKNHENVAKICAKAVQIDPYDEEIHILYLESLLAQNMHSAALKHYESATKFIYQSMGLSPSEKMLELYRRIMDETREVEIDLSVIQDALKEGVQSDKKAFLCEFGFFKYAYNMFLRLGERWGISLHLLLITIQDRKGAEITSKTNTRIMEQLADDIGICLRRSDVYCRYSNSQYLVLLARADYEDCLMVADRLDKLFAKHYRFRDYKLLCQVQSGDFSVAPGAEKGGASASDIA